jgi:hypothetical protein
LEGARAMVTSSALSDVRATSEDICAASIIFAGRDNYFCRLAPRLIESVRLRFIV